MEDSMYCICCYGGGGACIPRAQVHCILRRWEEGGSLVSKEYNYFLWLQVF